MPLQIGGMSFTAAGTVPTAGNTEFHYYLTAVTPPAGYAGATLYWDDEKDGLDTGDKPVMFKFNVANSYDAMMVSGLKSVMIHGEIR